MEWTPATRFGSCSNFCTTVASICAGVWPCAGRWTPCRRLFILSSFLDLRIWIVVSSRRLRESSAEMPALNWLLRCAWKQFGFRVWTERRTSAGARMSERARARLGMLKSCEKRVARVTAASAALRRRSARLDRHGGIG